MNTNYELNVATHYRYMRERERERTVYLRMDMNEDPFTCKNPLVNAHIELNEPKKSKFLKHVKSYLTTNSKCKLDVTNTIQVPF